jgi:hypothetical protein
MKRESKSFDPEYGWLSPYHESQDAPDEIGAPKDAVASAPAPVESDAVALPPEIDLDGPEEVMAPLSFEDECIFESLQTAVTHPKSKTEVVTVRGETWSLRIEPRVNHGDFIGYLIFDDGTSEKFYGPTSAHVLLTCVSFGNQNGGAHAKKPTGGYKPSNSDPAMTVDWRKQ